ncbi:pectinesterase 2-like [Bidens hawaiensis]|uniref:pectinesterase 2-like n=1 Tax=Bidens hawaiensis TaxID=980011 RepID=UPI0040491FCB
MCEKEFETANITNEKLAEISTNLIELLLNSLSISVVITGSTNPPSLHGWNFKDKHKLSKFPINKQPNIVVAKDGSGNFTTVQEAVNSAGQDHIWGQRYMIYVKTGVYEEQVVISNDVKFITMYGDGIEVWGRRFIAKGLTFQNTAGAKAGQAVAFLFGSDTSALYHCSFEGYQDTLFAFHSRQFYKECQIFGTVDFIFGTSQAVFQDCDIFLRKPHPGGGLAVTANGRKHLNQSGGYSLQGCKICAGDDLKPTIGEYKKAFLGRPWFSRTQTVFMQSFLDDLVDPAGWVDSWGYNKTTYYGEYGNFGPGSPTDQRVKWQGYHVITDPNIAQQFTVVEFIAGNDWLPKSNVPFVPGLENQ